MSRAPMSVTAPPATATARRSPGTDPSMLPPDSAARSTSTDPGFIAATMARRHEPRSGTAGNGRGRQDDVGCRDVRREQLLLPAGTVFGELLRVSAARFGRAEVEVDERAADRAHFVGGCRAHVVGRDHPAEPLRGRDRLQTRDTRAEHEHARRSERSGGGHRHAEHAPERVGRDRHESVARQQRLRRQHVHRLRARDARQQVEGERGHTRVARGS